MIEAPFSAAEAAAGLASLAGIFIALGGLLLMFRCRRLAGRAFLLGFVIAMFAGLAGQVFQ